MRRIALVTLLLVAACTSRDTPTAARRTSTSTTAAQDVGESTDCDHVDPGGSQLRSSSPPGASTVVTPAEHQVRGARLVYCDDLADPFVLAVDGRRTDRFYVFGTQAKDENIPVLRTHSVLTSDQVIDALPKQPAWARVGDSWAPTVLPRANGFVLYYTTTDLQSGRQCISRATSAKAGG